MSWKGFKKGLVRLPQYVGGALGVAEEKTVDVEYDELVKQLDETERSLQKVIDEARLYRHGVVTLLENQSQLGGSFAAALAGLENELDQEETPTEKAAILYREKMEEGLRSLTVSLGTLDQVIILPIQEMLHCYATARTWCRKRDRKLADYDRYVAWVKKMRETPGTDPAKITKAEAETAEITRVFEDINDLLKAEIPAIISLRVPYLDVCVTVLTETQCKIYKICWECVGPILAHIPLGGEDNIVSHYVMKSEANEHLFRRLGLCNGEISKRSTVFIDRPNSMYTKPIETREPLPLPVPVDTSAEIELYSGQNVWGNDIPGASITPVQPATPNIDAEIAMSQTAQYGTAMFDFSGQAEEDLAFTEGDTILILERTDVENDWWRGKNMRTGKEGVFPSNYIVPN